jgi:hypothetical protein
MIPEGPSTIASVSNCFIRYLEFVMQKELIQQKPEAEGRA